MSYRTETALHISFKDSPLVDLASGTSMTAWKGPLGSSVVTVPPTLIEEFGIHGLQLEDDVWHSSGIDLGITDVFSIGFWLKPINRGNPDPDHPQYSSGETLIAGLMSQATENYSSNEITLDNLVFDISEEFLSNGNNRLQIKIPGAVLTSSSYSTGEYHYFWIAYRGSTNTLVMSIDLVPDVGASITGSVPSSFSPSTAEFAINKLTSGSDSRTVRNVGVLGDLVILNQFLWDNRLVQMASRSAMNVASNEEYGWIGTSAGSMVSDPGNPTMASISDSRSGILVGSNNGHLYSAERQIWQVRRNFTKNEDLQGFDIFPSAPEGITSTSEGLVINSGIIKM